MINLIKNIIFIKIILILSSNLAYSKPNSFVCENKLTQSYIDQFDDFEERWCKDYPKRYGKHLSNCTRHELRLRKMKVCTILKENGLINWTHQQFIDVKKEGGIAYKYSIPCWEYGSSTPVLELRYIINKNVLILKDKNNEEHFKINLSTLRGGYGNKQDYFCKYK